ncbi:uncharacterized protein SCODWIG_02818 [Saccharomycodes ludwigii]|uniref:Uncharacterized protein n=2 Tax=Saccharomycodes ludwigii TaxID=36035 RepID=A0A376B8S7_9ASCO|nr:uncharacterized protein SCODWIG_02818 [Saccharomycodes ludwigii]
MYKIVSNSFNDTRTSTTNNSTKVSLKGLEDIEIKTGLLGICVTNLPESFSQNYTGNSVCFNRFKSTTNMTLYNDLEIKILTFGSSSSSSSNNDNTENTSNLNIFQIALEQLKIIHPGVLIATIVCSLFTFCFIVYVTVPYNLLPFKKTINLVTIGIATLSTVLQGFNAILIAIGVKTMVNVVNDATMNILLIESGNKAQAMNWTAFALLLLVCFILVGLYFRDYSHNNTKHTMSNKNKSIKEKRNPSERYDKDNNITDIFTSSKYKNKDDMESANDYSSGCTKV